MAALDNFFALLGDEESDALAIVHRAAAASPEKPPPKKQQEPPKLPSKPLPPSQAVKESKFSQAESGRGRGGRGGGRGNFGGREREREGGFNRPISGGFQEDRGSSYSDRNNSYNRDGNDFQGGRGGFYGRGGAASYGAPGNGSSFGEDGEVGHNFERGRGRGRGRARGRGYGEGADNFRRSYSGEQQQRRRFNERNGTGPGIGFKRDDTGNWGAEPEHGAPEESRDRTVEEEKHETAVVEKHETAAEKQPAEDTKVEPAAIEEKKTEEAEPAVAEEKKAEEEDNEMLLEDYYKMLNEKRKHLNTSRSEERKVIVDKDFEGMQLMNKKQEDEALLKHGSEKDKGKKKEISDNREGKAIKSVSINEFLRPVGGEEYYSPGGRRGRGRGRSDRGGYRAGFGGSYNTARQPLAPHIEDPGQFPILAVK